MATITVPLDTITAADVSGPHGVWVGTRQDHPDLRGVLRVTPGYSLDDADPILDGLGVVLGDTLLPNVDDEGNVWVDLYALDALQPVRVDSATHRSSSLAGLASFR